MYCERAWKLLSTLAAAIPWIAEGCSQHQRYQRMSNEKGSLSNRSKSRSSQCFSQQHGSRYGTSQTTLSSASSTTLRWHLGREWQRHMELWQWTLANTCHIKLSCNWSNHIPLNSFDETHCWLQCSVLSTSEQLAFCEHFVPMNPLHHVIGNILMPELVVTI